VNCVNTDVTNPKFLVNEYFRAGGRGISKFAGFNPFFKLVETCKRRFSNAGGKSNHG